MPDMSFHAGKDEHTPTVGGIKFKSDEAEIGLGDPRQSHTMSWQHLKSTSKIRTKSSFQASQATFTWKKASHVSFAHSLQLIEDSKDEVVALFKDNSNKLIQKDDHFDIEKDYGDQWNMMVFILGYCFARDD